MTLSLVPPAGWDALPVEEQQTILRGVMEYMESCMKIATVGGR